MPKVPVRSINWSKLASASRIHAPFAIRERVAEESRGDFLLLSGVRQLVTGNLLDYKLVVGHVAIDRVNHPLAVPPSPGALEILFVAIAIGVMRQIEPIARPLFSVVRGIEEPIDQTHVGVRALVCQEAFHFLRTGRQPLSDPD